MSKGYGVEEGIEEQGYGIFDLRLTIDD